MTVNEIRHAAHFTRQDTDVQVRALFLIRILGRLFMIMEGFQLIFGIPLGST